MSHSPYVFDASAENFARLVLENSARGPVLVNYWSPRAGPCLMLMPRLVRLATEFGGRFLLVMLNTDELGRLAREHGVVSLPTIKFFRHGQPVATLHGAESEDVLRGFIHKQLDEAPDTQRRAALTARLRADPAEAGMPLEVAKLLVLQQRYAQADDLLQALPDETRAAPELRRLAAHVAFLRAARDAPPAANLERAIADDPDDLESRYRLSAVRLVASDYEPAMHQLLEIARRDRAFRRDAGYEGLLALFELLGPDDERVRRYRSRLAELLPAAEQR